MPDCDVAAQPVQKPETEDERIDMDDRATLRIIDRDVGGVKGSRKVSMQAANLQRPLKRLVELRLNLVYQEISARLCADECEHCPYTEEDEKDRELEKALRYV